MAWTATGTAFEQAPVGTHLAKCIRIIDIGTQKGEYKGEVTYRRQCVVTWELPNETRDDDQPFIISKFYTASIGEKSNLYKDLTNWLGKPPASPFEPKDLLGKTCQVVISQREGSDKHVVSGLASVPKGIKLADGTHNPLLYLNLDLEEFDQEVFDGLSDGMKNMIMKSPEYAKIISQDFDAGDVDGAATPDDEPPF